MTPVDLFKRTLDNVKTNRFLFAFGILVAFLSGAGVRTSLDSFTAYSDVTGEVAQTATVPADENSLGVVLMITFLGIVTLFMVRFFSAVAKGALITSVESHEVRGHATPGIAWSDAWSHGLQLLIIDLLVTILPIAVGTLLFLILLGQAEVGAGITDVAEFRSANPVISSLMVADMIITGMVTLILNLWGIVARRVCMIRYVKAIPSFRRARELFRTNRGAIGKILYVQVLVYIVFNLILFLPRSAFAYCCFSWPALIGIQGAYQTLASTYWTLAYRGWAGSAQDQTN